MNQDAQNRSYIARLIEVCPPEHSIALRDMIEHLPSDRFLRSISFQIGLSEEQLERATVKLAVQILGERGIDLRAPLATALATAIPVRPESWDANQIIGNVHSKRQRANYALV